MAFTFPEFKAPEFERRKIKPVDIGGILRQAEQEEAVTGETLSPTFVRGIAEPAIKVGAQQAIATQRIEDVRELEERQIAFGEFEFEKELAFAEFKHEEEMELERKRLRVEEGKWCCFIFIESYGKLLNIVRKYRDEHMTDRNRRGYYKLADKIVPLMKKSKLFKWIVRLVMTDPMVSYGEYYYKQGKIGLIFKPVTKFWLKTFDLLGGDKPYLRKNGEVL